MTAIRSLLIAALLIALAVAPGVAPVTLSVLPRVAMAPASVRLTIRVEPNADNRWLAVDVTGANYQRSSGRELAGADAARLYQFLYEGLPTGTYAIAATVTTTHGRQSATSELEVRGIEGGGL